MVSSIGIYTCFELGIYTYYIWERGDEKDPNLPSLVQSRIPAGEKTFWKSKFFKITMTGFKLDELKITSEN